MRVEHMRRILTIVDEGGISNASKKLYISQPSLSQMVKSVEDKLGMPVFDRQAKHLTLTYSGEQFVTMARKIVSSYDSMLRDLQETQTGQRDKIIACMTQRRGVSYLSSCLPSYLLKYPSVTIEQTYLPFEEIENALLNHQITLYIGGTPIIHPHIQSIPLVSEQYMLIAPKNSPFSEQMKAYEFLDNAGYSRKLSITCAENEHFILPTSGYDSRRVFNQVAQEAGMLPRTVMEVTKIDVAKGMVSAGIGISILPIILTNDGKICDRNDHLRYFLLDSPYAVRSAYLCYDKTTYLSRAQSDFIQNICKSFDPTSNLSTISFL